MPVELLSTPTWLDRRSAARADSDHIDGLARGRDARFALFDGLEPVIAAVPDAAPAPVTATAAGGLWFASTAVDAALLMEPVPVFLGVARATGVAHFAVRLAPGARDALARTMALCEPADLRSLASRGDLPAGDVAAAGLARSLFAWHDVSRFCGACGAVAGLVDGGWRRRCLGCARETYPRVDAVVIMLVTDGERCLLGHEPRFPERMFSCLAGYVEPGEAIADAVIRETAEEVGLVVTDVRVVDSQPWPLPHSLMIGCVATAAPAPLTIDTTEIVEARWFSRAEARALLDRTHPEQLWVPGRQAIAHHLIAGFASGS